MPENNASLPAGDVDARTFCERVYCARGDMENRIKECQLDLFADRATAPLKNAPAPPPPTPSTTPHPT